MMERKYYTGEQILEALSEVGIGAGDISEVMSCLGRMPSAESEIIRCKDCKHMIINEKHEAKPMICCFTKVCGTTEPDWFCADGERREDE